MIQFLSTILLSFVVMTTAAPVGQVKALHKHHKRQDWGVIDWSKVNYDFSGVDWTKIDYSKVNWDAVFGKADQNVPVLPPAAVFTPAVSSIPVMIPATASVAVEPPKGQEHQSIPQFNPIPVVVQAIANDHPVQVVPTRTALPSITSASRAAATLVAPATSSVAVPAPPGSKRGLGWDASSPSSWAGFYATPQVTWYFNWSPTPSINMPKSMEFIANQWGRGGIANLESTLRGSPKLIGFNEPDSHGQSEIAITDAISLYKQYLTPLRKKGTISQLGSPAVTNSQIPGQGLDYLRQFMSGCTDCNIDFVVVHWYASSFDDFKIHVTNAHIDTGLPVNVAEFAYTSWNAANEPKEAEVLKFMTSAIAWLDAQPFVMQYAWFGSMPINDIAYPALGSANSLINAATTTVTTLGATYIH